jgi:FixJ family two-component response regulator
VLLDIRLHKTTGEEVFHRLKEENAAVKVVMVSG